MPDWATFAGFAGVVLVLLLLLAHASKSALSGEPVSSTRPVPGAVDPAVEDVPIEAPREDRTLHGHASQGQSAGARQMATAPATMSTMALLANVAVSQGAFGLLLVAGGWFTEIPLGAFGLDASTVSVATLALGIGLGVALYAANEVGATVGERLGIGADEGLREALAPSTPAGWAILLLLVLPIIAGFEELLFRGVLVGVFAAGFGVSPWVLAGLSSVAFALGHGAQGPAGVVVTGLLGFVLAAAFVVTGSLFVVFVAHYLVNALEFVVHEKFDVDWTA